MQVKTNGRFWFHLYIFQTLWIFLSLDRTWVDLVTHLGFHVLRQDVHGFFLHYNSLSNILKSNFLSLFPLFLSFTLPSLESPFFHFHFYFSFWLSLLRYLLCHLDPSPYIQTGSWKNKGKSSLSTRTSWVAKFHHRYLGLFPW